MKPYSTRLLPKLDLWSDILLLNISSLLAFLLAGVTGYQVPLLLCNLLWVVINYLLGNYRFSPSTYTFTYRILGFSKAVLLHYALVAAYGFLTGQGETPATNLSSLGYGLFVLLATLSRTLSPRLKPFWWPGDTGRTLTLAGECEQVEQALRQYYAQRPDLGFRYAGTFTFHGKGLPDEAVERFLDQHQPDLLYGCLSSLTHEQVQCLIRVVERYPTQLKLVPDYGSFGTDLTPVDYNDLLPVLGLTARPFPHEPDQPWKRAADVSLSLTAIVVGLPVLMLITGAVKLTSPGPVLYRQPRVGQHGKRFHAYRFRSLRLAADLQSRPAAPNDRAPRLTPIGEFLRESRLDELPQFLNVLQGDMSIVGPRPLKTYELDRLRAVESEDLPEMLRVKPGLTSLR
jgi:hypothetical protein